MTAPTEQPAPGGVERITLTNHILGLEPYVLIRFDIDSTDGEPVAKVEAGGGCDDIRMALLFALAGMDPLTDEEVEMLTAPRQPDEQAQSEPPPDLQPERCPRDLYAGGHNLSCVLPVGHHGQHRCACETEFDT